MESYFDGALKNLNWNVTILDGIKNEIVPAEYIGDGIRVSAYVAIYNYLYSSCMYSEEEMRRCLQVLAPSQTFPTRLTNTRKLIARKLQKCATNEELDIYFSSFICFPSTSPSEVLEFETKYNIPHIFEAEVSFSDTDSIINSDMLNLHKIWQKRGRKRNEAKSVFDNLFKSSFNDKSPTTDQVLFFWDGLKKKFSKLNKKKKESDVFMKEKCDFLGRFTAQTDSNLTKPDSVCNSSKCAHEQEMSTLIHEVKSVSSEVCHERKLNARKDKVIQSCDLKQTKDKEKISHLKNTIACLEIELKDIRHNFNEVKQKMASSSAKNLNRKISRRECTISEKNQTIETLKLKLHNFDLELKKQNLVVEELKKNKKKLQTSLSGYRVKSKTTADYIDEIKSDQTDLVKKVNLLQKERDFLESKLEDINSEEIVTKIGESYSDGMRATCVELQAVAQVSSSKVPQVIDIVSKNLFNKKVQNLPSRSTVMSMSDEGHILSKCHLGEVLSNTEHWDLHSDATTRDGARIVNISGTMGDGKQYSFGYSDIAQEDANSLVDNDIDVLNEVANIYSGDDDSQFLVQTIRKLTVLMSDRAANEKLHHKRFQDWADGFLQDKIEDENIKLNLLFLYCLSHVLLGFHSELVKILGKSLPTYGPLGRDKLPEFQHWKKGEPAVIRTIRLVGQTLGPRGDQKSGCREDWLCFCEGEGIKSDIISYRSNRFNCTFEGAQAVYHQRNNIVNFLSTGYKESNALLRTVCADLEDTVIIQYLRALGLIHFHVAGPFWQLSLSSEHHLKLGPSLTKLRDTLLALSNDPSPLFDKNMTPLIEKFPPKVSEASESLFVVQQGTQETTITALKEICKGFITVIERQLADYLPGGSLNSPSHEMIEKTKHTKLNNLICEYSFGDIDYTQKNKPNAKTHLHSSLHMLKKNKTMKWLSEKPQEEQSSLWKKAKGLKNKIKKNHVESFKQVRAKRLQIMQQRKLKLDNKAAEKAMKKVQVIDKAKSYGGPFLNGDIKNHLIHVLEAQATIKQKFSIVKNELMYQKLVLGMKGPLLRYSGLSLKSMFNNLLLFHDPNHTVMNLPTSKIVKSKKRKHIEVEDNSKESDSCMSISCDLRSNTLIAVAYDQPRKYFIGEIMKCLPSNKFEVNFLSQTSKCLFKYEACSKMEIVDLPFIFLAPVNITAKAGGRLWKVDNISQIETYFASYASKYFM